jgi:hypothetical protein
MAVTIQVLLAQLQETIRTVGCKCLTEGLTFFDPPGSSKWLGHPIPISGREFTLGPTQMLSGRRQQALCPTPKVG